MSYLSTCFANRSSLVSRLSSLVSRHSSLVFRHSSLVFRLSPPPPSYLSALELQVTYPPEDPRANTSGLVAMLQHDFTKLGVRDGKGDGKGDSKGDDTDDSKGDGKGGGGTDGGVGGGVGGGEDKQATDETERAAEDGSTFCGVIAGVTTGKTTGETTGVRRKKRYMPDPVLSLLVSFRLSIHTRPLDPARFRWTAKELRHSAPLWEKKRERSLANDAVTMKRLRGRRGGDGVDELPETAFDVLSLLLGEASHVLPSFALPADISDDWAR